MKQATTSKQPATPDAPPAPKRLYRLPQSGKIAGVCAGLAEYLDIDVTVMRLIFVVLTFASGGFGILVYIILAIVMPVSEASGRSRSATTGIEDNVQQLAEELRQSGGWTRARNYTGLAIIAFGAWLLSLQIFPGWIDMNWSIIWPVILMVIGLMLVIKGRS